MPAALAIVLDQSRVLLVKRRDMPVWVIPGGGIEKGESPEEGALREALEESGLDVKIIHKVGTYSKCNWLTDEAHVFLCSPKAGTTSLGPESRAVEWFEIDKLPHLLPPPHKAWIEHAASSKKNLKMPVPNASYFLFLKGLLLHPIIILKFLLSKMGVHFNK